MKQLYWSGLLIAAILSCSASVQALDQKTVAAIVSQFQSLPPAELPAAAARAVRKADETVRAEVSGIVVSTIAAREPSAVPQTVTAILGVQPSLAPIIVPLGAESAPEAATNLLAITSRLAPAFAKQTAKAMAGVLKTAGVVAPATATNAPAQGGAGASVAQPSPVK
jgi:hypothetical protein